MARHGSVQVCFCLAANYFVANKDKIDWPFRIDGPNKPHDEPTLRAKHNDLYDLIHMKNLTKPQLLLGLPSLYPVT